MPFTQLSLLKKLAVSWTVMWASSYIIVAVLASNILATGITSAVVLFLYGVYIMVGVAIRITPRYAEKGRIVLLCAGFLSLLSAFGSFTGVITWDIPFVNNQIFQYSMGTADTLGAIAMFILAR